MVLQAKNTQKFIEHFFYIRNKKAELQNLIFNKAQLKIYEEIDKCRRENKPVRLIILKSRRHGVSTEIEALMYDDTIKRENVHSMVVSHELKSANELFDMTKLFDNKLAFRQKKETDNVREMCFENRSKIRVDTAENVATGRAGSYTNLHLSELAHYRDAEMLMTALLPTVPNIANTMIIVESTANGVGNYFYKMWTRAVKGEIDFTPIFLSWSEDSDNVATVRPDFKKTKEEIKMQEEYNLTDEQLQWRRNTISTMFNDNIELFQQEYPLTPEEAFIGSGRPVFNISALKKIPTKKAAFIGSLLCKNDNPIFDSHYGGALEIWNNPLPNGQYVIGADTSEGLENSDYCAAIVRDRMSWEQCAVLWGRFEPHEFAAELELLGKYYKNAKIGVEANNQGIAVLHELLHNLRYPNLYYDEGWDDIKRLKTKKLGFWTDTKSKPRIINDLARVINEENFKIYSSKEVAELMVYNYLEGNKMGAVEGEHDDLVMSEAICLHLLIKYPYENKKEYVPILSRAGAKWA